MSAPSSRLAPWEDFVLRVIAIWKLIHAVFFTAVGFGLLRLRHHNIVDFLNAHLIVPYHLNPESHAVDWILEQAQKINPHMLMLAGWASFIYASVFATEGVGLYLRKRWAEWLVVVATGFFLPLEIYELFRRAVWWKFVILTGNVLIVAYLAHRITLDASLKPPPAEPGEGEDEGTRPPEGSAGFDVGRSSAVPTKAR